jgi:hypothetical protein
LGADRADEPTQFFNPWHNAPANCRATTCTNHLRAVGKQRYVGTPGDNLIHRAAQWR